MVFPKKWSFLRAPVRNTMFRKDSAEGTIRKGSVKGITIFLVSSLRICPYETQKVTFEDIVVGLLHSAT
jgi:hypothetical protein